MAGFSHLAGECSAENVEHGQSVDGTTACQSSPQAFDVSLLQQQQVFFPGCDGIVPMSPSMWVPAGFPAPYAAGFGQYGAPASWAEACGYVDGAAGQLPKGPSAGDMNAFVAPPYNAYYGAAPFTAGEADAKAAPAPEGAKTGKRSRRGGKKGKKERRSGTDETDSAGETSGSGREEAADTAVPISFGGDSHAALKIWLDTVDVHGLEASWDVRKTFSRQLEGGGLGREAIVQWFFVADRTVECSKLKHSCRIVQEALLQAKGAEKGEFLQRIVRGFNDLVKCPNGNHVVQKLPEVQAADALAPLINCFRGQELQIARDRYGCRVWERLIEHCHDDIEDIVKELLPASEALCRHQFGNFVISSLLEHRVSAHAMILQQMRESLPLLVMHRTSSHVVQKAFQHCDVASQVDLVNMLLQAPTPNSIVDIACHKAGSYVIQELSELANKNEPNLRFVLGQVRRRLEQANIQSCLQAAIQSEKLQPAAQTRVMDAMASLPAY